MSEPTKAEHHLLLSFENRTHRFQPELSDHPAFNETVVPALRNLQDLRLLHIAREWSPCSSHAHCEVWRVDAELTDSGLAMRDQLKGQEQRGGQRP